MNPPAHTPLSDLAAMTRERNGCAIENVGLHRDLTASTALVEKLREALKRAYAELYEKDDIMRCRTAASIVIERALALTADTQEERT